MEQKNALFEQMPVRKAFFKLALPVVLSMVVSLVYNMVDTYFIAKPAMPTWWPVWRWVRRCLP